MIGTTSHAALYDTLVKGGQYLSTLPAAFLLSLTSLVLFARARLGFWPTPNINDPKDIGVSYVVFHLLTLVLFLGFLIGALFTPQKGPRIRPARAALAWSALSLVLWALFILVTKYDPGRYVEWIFD